MNSSKITYLSVATLLGLLYLFCIPYGSAFQVYKWVDENGRVHFGDRANAPANGKQVDIKVKTPEKPKEAAASLAPQIYTRAESLAIPKLPAIPVAKPIALEPLQKKASKPADPSKVPSVCKGLIDQIAKVEPGTPWQGLAKSYSEACPGITYECNNYRSTPEKNHCLWVERNGSAILSTNNYQ